MPIHSSGAHRATVTGPAITFGFGAAVIMWCAWWFTHLPAIGLPPTIAGPLLLAIMLVTMIWAARASGPAPAWQVGVFAGFLTSALNLLVLGSFIARPPQENGAPAPGFEGLGSSAGLVMLGFLGVGLLTGLVGGVIGGALRPRTPEPSPVVAWSPSRLWLSRYALVALLSVFPLLLLGGAVTSTASGMAVPGWPDSYGANMFLYPIKLMSHPRVFLEHTHRLFGSLVGLTILTLAIWTLISEPRRSVKIWGVVLFVLVCLQGVLGGLRVIETSVFLAFVHGVFAQIFLVFVACVAGFLSVAYHRAAAATPEPADRRRRGFSMGLQHSTILQLILGAAYRHFGQVSGNKHALWTHAAFSLVVVGMAAAAGFIIGARKPAGDTFNATLRRLGGALVGVVGVQFLLGWGAFFSVLHAGSRGPSPASNELATAKAVPIGSTIVETLHQANGALLLTLATLAVVLTRRVWKNRPPAPRG